MRRLARRPDYPPQAKNYALRLIKFRARSAAEVADKLEAKGFSQKVIDGTIAFLKQKKFLDDALFAKLWVSSRLKRSLGLRRLIYELKQKGIDQGLIDNAIESVKSDYDEKKTVYDIVETKSSKMRGLAAEKIRSRLYGYLLRRGYPKNLVVEALLSCVKTNEGWDSDL